MLDIYKERINGFIQRNGFVTYRQVLNSLGFCTEFLDDSADYTYWDEDGIHYGNPFVKYSQGAYPLLDFNIDDTSNL